MSGGFASPAAPDSLPASVKRVLVVLSVLLNLVIVVTAGVALWLYANPDEIRERVVGPRRDRTESFYEEFAVSPGEYVFLGDSITRGGFWEEMFPSAPIKGRGVGGDMTRDLLARLDAITSGMPGRIYLMIGTNDLFVGVPRDEILANVRELIERVRRESPATELYVQSVLPRGAEFRERIVDLNTELESLVLTSGGSYIDLYALFVDPDGSLRDDYTNDELHLNGLGYRRWQQALLPHVVGRGALPSSRR